jgi:DeoR family fructose operon transcriptional repressor
MPFATASARHQHILALLQQRGEIRAGELASELGVTSMTTWRDLKLLSEQGLLRRVRGGAIWKSSLVGEPLFESKLPAASQAKCRIARAAVEAFVREGEVIAMEGGTTVAALGRELPESRVSVITNSLPIALQIRERKPALPLRVIGGWLSPISGNATGPEAIKEIKSLRASLCFLSCTGWDPEMGPQDPNPLEIEVKRTMAAISKRVVLLIDSAKFSVSSQSVLIHPRHLTAVVTDGPVPRVIRSSLKTYGVRIIVTPV